MKNHDLLNICSISKPENCLYFYLSPAIHYHLALPWTLNFQSEHVNETPKKEKHTYSFQFLTSTRSAHNKNHEKRFLLWRKWSAVTQKRFSLLYVLISYLFWRSPSYGYTRIAHISFFFLVHAFRLSRGDIIYRPLLVLKNSNTIPTAAFDEI